MAYRSEQKITFDPSRTIQPIYTGGPISLSSNGRLLAACVGEIVQVTDLTSGAPLVRIEGDGESITSLGITPDANALVICSRSATMRWYDIISGDVEASGWSAKLNRTFKPHNTPVVTTCIDESGSLLATGASDGVVKVWDLRGGYATHTFHGHAGLVSALRFFQADPAHQSQTPKHKRRSDIEDTEGARYRLASGDEDGKIRIWDLHRRKCLAVLDSHASVVRSLAYNPENGILASGSRDRTVIVWSASTFDIRQIVPVTEGVESIGFLLDGRCFYTGGEKGDLRVWQTTSGSEMTRDQAAGIDTDAILDVFPVVDAHALMTVHADQVLRFYDTSVLTDDTGDNLPPLSVERQISGTHDEIIDLAYVGVRAELLALATNLDEVRLVSIKDTPSAYFGADVASLRGHSDIVISMSVDWSGCWLATGAKDNTARLWRLDADKVSFECYETFTGHTQSVGAIALPSSAPINGATSTNPLESPPQFLLTGSSDTTIKKWDIANDRSLVKARWTRKAHDKDINALATSYSPTLPLAASASQDKTVRIWDIESGEAIAVLRGHKRGVWTVAFSPLDVPALSSAPGGGGSSGSRGMVLTGSADKTVRVWSLTDYSCIRTFEGHANSVLKTVWLPRSTTTQTHSQSTLVASAAGDGLVKVWDAQGGECAATLDNHTDRVWSLAVRPDLHQRLFLQKKDLNGENALQPTTLVSGSADATMTFWVDSTEITSKKANDKAVAKVEQDQELQNHIRASNYREAIVLALQLNHPKRLLELFTSVIDGEREDQSLIGKHSVDEVLSQLSNSQLWLLLQRCRDWNANARTYHVAQHILWALLHIYPKERLLRLGPKQRPLQHDSEEVLSSAMSTLSTSKAQSKRAETPKDLLDALKAYTERHDQRLAKLGEERFVLEWALQSMDGYSMPDVHMVNGT